MSLYPHPGQVYVPADPGEPCDHDKEDADVSSFISGFGWNRYKAQRCRKCGMVLVIDTQRHPDWNLYAILRPVKKEDLPEDLEGKKDEPTTEDSH